MADRQNINLIQRIWPDAKSIRSEGRCDDCKKLGLHSFLLPYDWNYEKPIVGEIEHCSYYCCKCGFAAGGTRFSSVISVT